MENLPKPFEQEWNLEFHGVTYIINMTVTEVLLTLELENANTTERWSAQFTAQAVEEFTHKAGNIKKLSVFSKMLASSFSKDNDSLHVDILTYTDLALLKAARKGSNTSSNDIKPNSSMTQSKQNPEQWQKRYIILTYRGEFNHNHYPLPLDFEDKPNFPALKRTIARLRKYILDKEKEEKEPATEKERELREMVSKLRQDNTELRHRLRHGSSNTLNTSITNASMLSGAANIHALNSEISNTNVKLRKQVEVLKKELQDLSHSYEQLRTESAREIARWKLKITGTNATSSPSNHSIGSDHSHTSNTNMRSQSILIAELRQKNTALEKELRYERLHRGANATPTRGWSSSTNTHSKSGIADRYNASRRSTSADTMRRSTSATTGRSNSVRQGWNTSTSERERNPSRGSNHSRTGSRSGTPTTGNMTRRSASPVVGPNTASTTRYRTREASPPLRPRGGGRIPDSQNPTPTSARRSSPALSTSLGGRFDPTAYQQDRAQRLQQAQHSRAWGAGTGSSPARYRYHSPAPGESGYTSANSQSSRGSRQSQRSQRSQRSEISQGMSSTASKNSQTRKKATKKKKSTSAALGSTKRSTGIEKSGHYTNKTISAHVLSNEISTTATAKPASATSIGSRVGDRSTWGAGHRVTKKSSEIGRVNSKYSPAASNENHTLLSVGAKHLHRRSRESPDGDSETDDSEFLPPTVNRSLERARQSAGLQPPHHSLPPPPPSTATRAVEVGIPTNEEEETAYNTYVNVVSNSKIAHDQDISRRSHERLVAVAKERSSYLDHEDSSSDIQEAAVRNSGNSLRSSSEQPQQQQPQQFESKQLQAQQQQVRTSRESAGSLGKDLRTSLDSAKSMASLSKALGGSPHLSKKARPVGGGGGGGSSNSTALSELRNSIGSLRASKDRNNDLHPTTAAVGVGSSTSTLLDDSLPTEELSAMDKRIKALQAYLDNARFT